jgi:hypothetical protein
MKLTHKTIQLKIITIFAIVFLTSFIPEQFPKVFGDYVCDGKTAKWNAYGNMVVEGTCNFDYDHYPKLHWGWRHWVWLFCGVVLFIYNFCLVISNIETLVDKRKDECL